MSVSFLNEPALPASVTTSTNYPPIKIDGLTAEEYAHRWQEIIQFYNDYWNSQSTQKPVRRIQRIKRRK